MKRKVFSLCFLCAHAPAKLEFIPATCDEVQIIAYNHKMISYNDRYVDIEYARQVYKRLNKDPNCIEFLPDKQDKKSWKMYKDFKIRIATDSI